MRWVGKPGYNMLLLGSCGVVIQLLVPVATSRVTGLLFGNHIVDASSLVSFYHPRVANAFEPFAGWCVV